MKQTKDIMFIGKDKFTLFTVKKPHSNNSNFSKDLSVLLKI